MMLYNVQRAAGAYLASLPRLSEEEVGRAAILTGLSAGMALVENIATSQGSDEGSGVTGGGQTYHRLESSTQTPALAATIQSSGQLRGSPAQGSTIPAAKAYLGPLKPGKRGIEFTTTVKPSSMGSGKPGATVKWNLGDPGVVEVEGQAAIPVCVTNNTQC